MQRFANARTMAAVTSFALGAFGGAAHAASAEPEPDAPLTRHDDRWAFVYDGNLFANVDGGARRGASYNGLVNASFEHVFRSTAGVPDVLFFVDAAWIHGSN